jgi:hypothetical protein
LCGTRTEGGCGIPLVSARSTTPTLAADGWKMAIRVLGSSFRDDAALRFPVGLST